MRHDLAGKMRHQVETIKIERSANPMLRKRYSPQEKLQIVIEALKEESLIADIASKDVYKRQIQRYATVCKQIFDMVPDPDAGKQAEDEFMAFVKKAKR